ncbi:MAG: glutathione S-transferase [Candidatus Desulfobacillus denitrificans]|jgi:glutathione S-transferase|uniref:Glutathione S-transferase n=1 Tax=Candidatus Desulfobacillus denitrificans TaxID=2608985 RepID=A0A809RUV2_9PROT|nr:glutathione S-transferase [Rhodocyclaceae bacterium]OQY68980.1 MAG: glutathione S-transferase [Rhodocyclaceae bacterium UTPRO2]BBO20187.1 glutathione S-transferase [Candidatus Desulfobacillus denitrificans]GIK46002.1 MAG: glutathione S-transferase [Betaproteobacteria bacterium]GJQ54984.1 MAG: glutathione S-transferase [Rhodocyclaceae bacterium]
MKLIGSLTSPYVRKTRIALAEKKIEYEFVLDNPWSADTGVARLNPLGKVPVLVLDDDSTLFDSRVIVEYIDGMTPNNRLMPAAGRERIRIKRWEALADGVMDASVAAFLEARRPKKEQSASWVSRQREKIDRCLEMMAEELGEQPWCSGTIFSLADIAVGCALGYLDFRLADIHWRERHPNLARLFGELMERPSFAETVPQG